MNLLDYAFMQRALITALMTGLMAPAIGTYIVQRRLSLLGDGLGHVAIAGVGLAVMTNTAPLPVAIVVCVVGAVVVELLRQFGKASGDVGLAILFYGGLASGVLMAGFAGQGAGALSQYLFGSLTTVSPGEVWLVAALAALMLIVSLGLAPQLFAASTDEEYARVLGLPVRAYNLLVVVLAAITVTVSMRTVGLLLISALMVIPVAAAQHLVVSFRAALFGAMGIGVLAALMGTGGSLYLDSALGATIVVSAIILLGIAAAIEPLLLRRRRFLPYVEDHGEHAHEVAADHPPGHRHDESGIMIQHGEHVDVVGSEDDVDVRRTLDDPGAILLGEAPADGDLHTRVCIFGDLEIAQVSIQPVGRIFSNCTRVEYHKIWRGIFACWNVAIRFEQSRNAFRIVHVHLAPEGADFI